MKKLLGLLLMAMLLGVTACEGPEGPIGPEGPPGRDGAATLWFYKDFIVQNKHWSLAGRPGEAGSYYYCLFTDVPEITRDIYEDGLILCSYRYTDDTGANVQAPLPYTEYGWDMIGGNRYDFSMYFSYNVTPGSIEFRVTFSDFDTYYKGPPESCFFRLTLVY